MILTTKHFFSWILLLQKRGALKEKLICRTRKEKWYLCHGKHLGRSHFLMEAYTSRSMHEKKSLFNTQLAYAILLHLPPTQNYCSLTFALDSLKFLLLKYKSLVFMFVAPIPSISTKLVHLQNSSRGQKIVCGTSLRNLY